MASRFPNARSAPTNSLFSAYDAQTAQKRPQSNSPASFSQAHSKKNDDPPRSASSLASGSGGAFGAYPGAAANNASANGLPNDQHYRAATPNKRGQYSDAVLNELESQNDSEIEGLTGKVRMLKDLTTAIGDEIRSSSTLAEAMNNTFENTRVRLRGTMNRMLRMAERTGVGWKVWLGFFVAVWMLFAYVWLF